MIRRLAPLAIALLAGCASSSGVHRIGYDGFSVSTSASPDKGGVPAALRAAREEAVAECKRRGQQLQVTEERSTSPTFTDGMVQATLNFRCV